MRNSSLFRVLISAPIYWGLFCIAGAQDLAELSMKARNSLYVQWNFDSAKYYFEQVIGKDDTPAFAYSDYGWYLLLENKDDEGLANIRKAAEMSPSDRQLVAWHAWLLLWRGDLPEAKRWITKSLAMDPNYGEALYVASMIESEMGNHQEALELAKKAASQDSNWRVAVPLAHTRAGQEKEALSQANQITNDRNAFDAILLVEVYARLGYHDKAMDSLQKAFELRHPFMPWLRSIPGTLELHSDSRFKSIVEKMNLPN